MEIKKKEFLNEYNWNEINYIAKNNLGRKYFKLWDLKIMKGTNGNLYECRIIGFNHDAKSDGSGKAGITFLVSDTDQHICGHYTREIYEAYKYPNGISWVGSNIRKECLEKGQERFVYIEELKDEKDYYFYNTKSNQFEITKNSNKKLYEKIITTENGELYNLIPKDIMNNIVSVKKKTWGGYGGSVVNRSTAFHDNTPITTNDKLWILSAGEFFGIDKDGCVGKYKIEGNQYKAFKKQESRIGNHRWLRSPFWGEESYFFYRGGFHENEYLLYREAYLDFYFSLCFCL